MANRTWLTLKTELAEYGGVGGSARGKKVAEYGLKQALRTANRRGSFDFLIAYGQVTLASGTRNYATSGITNFGVHIRTVMLNSAGNRPEKEVNYLTEEDFFTYWMETTTDTGAPDFFTITEGSNEFLIDRDPTTTYAGRKLRTAYYKQLVVPADNATLGITDEAEEMIFQDAIWRFQQLMRIPGWQEQERIAKQAIAQQLAFRRSDDYLSHGVT